MSRKYFFFDIDDTLVHHNPYTDELHFPDSARRTLEQLRANGHFISIATGRARWMTEEIRLTTGIDNLVTDGGNGIVLGGKVVEVRPMDREKSLKLCKSAYEAGFGVGVMAGDNKNLYCKDDIFPKSNPQFQGFINYVIDPDLDFDQIENFHKIFVGISKEQEKEFPVVYEMSFMRYHPQSIMVEPADKFVGIKRVMDYIGGDLKDVVVFGDGWNDIDMFNQAAFSIAMGNAVDGLKEIADYVTKDVNDDGIEYACRHFGWIK